MDALTELLRGVRADGAVVWRADRRAPWSWLSEEAPPLTLYAVLRGTAWLVPADGSPERLTAGDAALVRGPGPHRMSDSPDTRPQTRIHAARHCTPLAARPPGGGNVLFAGAYRNAGNLPDRLVVPGGASSAALRLLDEEIGEPGPVLDRALDLLMVRALRTWLAEPRPVWHKALGDPVAGPVLRAIHAAPGHPWTADALAARAGVSRATLYRHFTGLLGESPLSYLTAWRMALAADLLRDTTGTVAAIAREVGYTNPFAFSTAFRRAHGRPPAAFRSRGAAAP